MSLNLETRGHLVHFDALAISPNGENLYVFDSISGEASIISIASKTKVNTFQIDGEVSGMVFNSDGSKAYVLAKRGTKGGEISVLNISTNTIQSVISTIHFMRGNISISPDDSKLHLALTNQTGLSLITIDNQKNVVNKSVRIEEVQSPILFSKDGGRLFIASYISSNECDLLMIDTSTYLILNRIMIGKQCPSGMAINENGQKLAVSLNGDHGQIIVIDTQNLAVAEPILVRAYPEALNFSKDGAAAYVINTGNDNFESPSISKVDIGLNTVIAETPIKSHPRYLAMSSDGGKVFLLGGKEGPDSSRAVGYVTIVDSKSNKITAIIPINTSIGCYLKMQMWELASWIQKNIFRNANQVI